MDGLGKLYKTNMRIYFPTLSPYLALFNLTILSRSNFIIHNILDVFWIIKSEMCISLSRTPPLTIYPSFKKKNKTNLNYIIQGVFPVLGL